jgi:hypothetical protein
MCSNILTCILLKINCKRIGAHTILRINKTGKQSESCMDFISSMWNHNGYICLGCCSRTLYLSTPLLYLWFMVFNITFNNISAISWQSVLLAGETGVRGENHSPVASHWDIVSHIVVFYISNSAHGVVVTINNSVHIVVLYISNSIHVVLVTISNSVHVFMVTISNIVQLVVVTISIIVNTTICTLLLTVTRTYLYWPKRTFWLLQILNIADIH